MWMRKKKRTIKLQTKSSQQQDPRSQVRNEDAVAETRPSGLYDGDLKQGDEGIDDPPEKA